MRFLYLHIFLIPILLLSQNQKKLALVIGNEDYIDKNAILTNPVNDSKLMAETFKELAFDSIIIANNLNYNQMRSAFSSYKRELRNNFDVGFIYYSGHGTQDSYNNSYLIPVDFPSNPTITDVEDQAYDFHNFLKDLERMEDKLHIVILDACRNNPFEKGWKGKSISGTGLAEPNIPAIGVLVHYSTKAGYVANDNVELNNSLYTEILASVMKKPNLKIEEIFKETGRLVRSESAKNGSLQSPQLFGEFEGDLYLLLKKDYTKIEVKSLQKEAEEDKKKGNIESAIKKYTVLQNYFESSMQNIDKKKLIKVYLDIGQIYWEIKDSVNTHQEYLDLQTKSYNSFFNAKLLLETEGINSQEEKESYSEAFYKYLRVKSYVDWDQSNFIDSIYIENGKKLIQFNKENFGINNFRTACSNYLTGIFLKEKEPLMAYNLLTISSMIFSEINYTNQNLINYALTSNLDYLSYKWSISALNTFIEAAMDENSYFDTIKSLSILSDLKENITNNIDSIYLINQNIINKGIELSKLNNNVDIEAILAAGVRFCDHFPLLLNVINEISDERYEKMVLSSINFGDLQLEYAQNYLDSIDIFTNNSRRYKNIVFISNKLENNTKSKYKQKIFKLENDAFNIAMKNKNGVNSLDVLNYSFKSDFYLRDSLLFTKNELVKRLKLFNNIFNNIIIDYRNINDQSTFNFYFNQYDEWMQYYIDNQLLNFTDDRELISNFAEQRISKIMNDNLLGYGHYEMVEAYNYKANLLYGNGIFNESKLAYINLLNHINNNKDTWEIESDNNSGFLDANHVVFVKYSYAYGNYMLCIPESDGLYNDNDLIMIEKLSNFLEHEKTSLLKYNLYYRLKLLLLRAQIYYYWDHDNSDIISFCNEALEILKIIQKDQSKFNGIGWPIWNTFEFEDTEFDFYSYKINWLSNKDIQHNNYVNINHQLVSAAKKWKEKEKIFPIMDAYSYIVWYYKYFDVKKYKSESLKAFEIGNKFLENNDFTYFENPKDAKLLLLMNTGEFLVHSTELATNPSIKERFKTIEFYKSIENYILLNYESVLTNTQSYGFEHLRQVNSILCDQLYFVNEKESAIDYLNKDLNLIDLYNDSVTINNEKLNTLKFFTTISQETDSINRSLNYYNQYVEKIDFLNTNIDMSCSLIDKDYNSCVVPFISVKIKTYEDVWPCLEFDVDKNNLISENDKRYYISKNNLIVEGIKNINFDIGGFYNKGVNEMGELNDTSSYIFFEKENRISSSAYFIKSQTNNSQLPVEWEFLIPKNELISAPQDKQINMIINLISRDQGGYTLSRRYEKFAYPLKSKFTKFKDSYKIKL